MLASRVRQSIAGAGPTSFQLVDDAASTQSRTIVTAYGSGSGKPGIFTIIDVTANQWAVVEGYATAGSTDTFTVNRTLRNSAGTSVNLTWNTTNTKTIFAGECADVLAFLTQCPQATLTGAAYSVTFTPSPLALPHNTVLRILMPNNGTYGSYTLSVNGLPAWPIKRGDGSNPHVSTLSGLAFFLVDAVNQRFLHLGTAPADLGNRVFGDANIILANSSPTLYIGLAPAGLGYTNTDWGISLSNAGGNQGYAQWRKQYGTGNKVAVDFIASSPVGSITYSDSSTSFNTTSDYRLKDEVEPLTGALDRLDRLPFYRFRWKATPDSPKVDGVFAHEAQAVVPEAVQGEKDAVTTMDERDETGAIVSQKAVPAYQSIDQSKLVPLIGAAVKELHELVQSLQARIAGLEAERQS